MISPICHHYLDALLSKKEGARIYLTAHSNRIGTWHQWQAKQCPLFKADQPAAISHYGFADCVAMFEFDVCATTSHSHRSLKSEIISRYVK